MGTRSAVMVGRDADLQLLRELLDRAGSGDPQFVLIMGEAGIGKSRLVRELLTDLPEGFHRGFGAAAQITAGAVPYGVVSTMFRDLVEVAGVERTREVVGSDFRDLAALLPSLGVQPDAPDRLNVVRASRSLVEAVCQESPWVVILEDLHWADDPSLDVISYCARTMTKGCVLFVATARDRADDEDRLARVVELGHLPNARMIALKPLSREAVVAQATALDLALEGRRLEDIQRLSQGVPLFVEELAAQARDDAAGVPESLRVTLNARLRALDHTAIEVLTMAAVDPRPFTRQALVDVTGAPQAWIDRAVDQGVGHGLLDAIDRDAFRFHHHLLREAAVASLPPSKTSAAHEAWARRYEAEPIPSPIDLVSAADHRAQAGDHRKAFDARVRAARALAPTGATSEVTRQWRAALDLIHEHPSLVSEQEHNMTLAWATRGGVQERFEVVLADLAAAPQPSGARRCFLELTAYWSSRVVQPGRFPYLPAPDMGSMFDDLAAAEPSALVFLAVRAWIHVEDLLEDTEAQARGVGLLERVQDHLVAQGLARDNPDGVRFLMQAKLDALPRSAVAERARVVARAMSDAPALDSANRAFLGLRYTDVLMCNGDLGRALAEAETSLALIPGPEADVNWYLSAYMLARVQWLTGHWDEALRLTARCRGQQEYPDVAMISLAVEAIVRTARGDEGVAEAAEALWPPDELYVPTDSFAHAERYAPGLVRALDLERNDPASAREALRPMLASVGGPWLVLGEELVLASRLAWRGGVADQRYVEQVRRTAEERLTPGRLDRSWGTEIEAHLLRAAGKDKAEAWASASESWQELGVPYRASECRVRLAEVLLSDGQRESAADHLAAAVSTAEQLNAQPLADEARTLAARGRLALPGATHESSRGGLTDREFEVLQLLATGNTNDQIAATLYMSPKTASVHVSHIIAKLDASNRTEVASIAHRRGLLNP